MGLFSRISNKLAPPRRSEAGVPIQAVTSGRAAPLLLPLASPSTALMAVGDATLASVARRASNPVNSREDARLASLVALALSARENACEAHGIAAVAELDAVLASLVVDEGLAWEHSSDVAWRLMRLSLLLAYLPEEIDPGMRRLIAGAAEQHAVWLEDASLETPTRFHRRRVLQSAALVVAGLRWPSLSGASRWWSQGLSQLRRSYPNLLDESGAPSTELSELLESTEAVACVLLHGKPTGIGLPVEVEGAFLRALLFLGAHEGVSTSLNGCGFESLWGAEGLGRVAQGRRMLSMESEAGLLTKPNSWVLSVFREGGWAFAHGGSKSGSLSLRWCLDSEESRDLPQPEWGDGDLPVLLGGRGGMFRQAAAGFAVERARVDGRSLQVRCSFQLPGQQWVRTLRAEGSRLVVDDMLEGEDGVDVSLTWRVAPGWSWDGASQLSQNGKIVKVGLPAELDWSMEDTGEEVFFRASGWIAPGTRLFSRFELR
ncbi:MAG: hypothetical protein VXW32_11240 [Myxococcota bacterium]|nr:hypothetical protein [Myxococcota bacterium]